ncbi:hypothetical protein [Nocardia cyriacigeorgica]|uniref:hypothetical protein n=1 Tax=Nocardia cyriacigeorgica TaxID=135487 RepID=UPI002457C227|nr:hypothetical protein [Nocardia cyriacigeorgica]
MSAANAGTIPALLHRFFDDAAIFPPARTDLSRAVAAHVDRRSTELGDIVATFVIDDARLPALADLTAAVTPHLDLAITVTAGPAAVAGALDIASTLENVVVRALEIRVPDAMSCETFFAALDEAPIPGPVAVFVEIPRDERGDSVITETAARGRFGKFRTGGLSASAHPDENELAAGIIAAVSSGVPFKCTAGLHHAVRNTDQQHGFEQHGALNVLCATAAAIEAAPVDAVARWLALRDPAAVAEHVAGLDPRVRSHMLSVGSCSISEPVADFRELGLLEQAPSMKGEIR